MARKHKNYGCIKPLAGSKGKREKCAVHGLQGVEPEKAGRYSRRCDIKGVGLSYGRWKNQEGKKVRGWTVKHHGKAVGNPVKTKSDAIQAMGEYLGNLLELCKSCK